LECNELRSVRRIWLEELLIVRHIVEKDVVITGCINIRRYCSK